MQPLTHPALEGPRLPRMVGVSAALHVLVLALVLALDLVRPRPEIFRDVIQVDLVTLPQAPEAVVVPQPAPPEAQPAEPAPPPPPKPEVRAVEPPKPLPPLKENPLWAKLDRLDTPPPKAEPAETPLSEKWKQVAKTPPPKPAPTPKEAPKKVPKEDLKQWWYDQMSTAKPTVPPPPDVKVPEQKSVADAWRKINSTLPEAVRLGEAEIAQGNSGELAEWWKRQLNMALAPDQARQTQVASETGTPQYLALVQNRVGARWSPPDIFRDQQQVVVVLAFELAPDGHVRKVRIDRSSGSAFYDQAALRAIYLSDPFPPFPKEVKDTSLDIRITLSLDRGRLG